MEKVVKNPLYNPAGLRNKLKTFYRRKFYNAFASLVEWGGYLEKDDETREEITSLQWDKGAFAFYPSFYADINLTAGQAKQLLDEVGARSFVATSFAVQGVNVYNKASAVNPIVNSPKAIQRGNIKLYNYVDCVLCYVDPFSIHRGYGVGIWSLLEPKINQIINAEMTIFTNIILHKVPYEIFTEEENKNAVASVLNQLFNDEIAVFATGIDPNMIKPFNNAIPELYMNLYGYVRSLENEVYSLIGLDNGAVIKMAERSTVDEANANNVQTNANALMYLEQMKQFCKDVKKVFKLDITVKLKNEMSTSVHNDIHNDGDNNEEEDEEGGTE